MPPLETESSKLAEIYREETVNELMINADGSVFVERSGGVMERVAQKISDDALGAFMGSLLGEAWRPERARPYLDLSARDGSRVHVVAPPIVPRGFAANIRKKPAKRPSLLELAKGGTLPMACAEFLNYAVFCRKNILLVGGASSGKTTLLNALAQRCEGAERLLVLEDTPELDLPLEHVLNLQTRIDDPEGHPDVTLHDLVRNALRMRPDRLIVGETRGPEAGDLLQAMNVGLAGVMTTLHANSSREGLVRLETLTLLSGVELPLRALRQNIAAAIDLIVVLQRFADGSRRVIQVSEATGMDEDTLMLADLFAGKTDEGAGSFALEATGVVPKFYDALRKQGMEPPTEYFQR